MWHNSECTFLLGQAEMVVGTTSIMAFSSLPGVDELPVYELLQPV